MSTINAKSLPDVLMKVLEKFEICLDKLADKLESKLDKIYGNVHDANGRIDKIELKIMELEKAILDQSLTGLISSLAIPAHYGLAQPNLKADGTLQMP